MTRFGFFLLSARSRLGLFLGITSFAFFVACVVETLSLENRPCLSPGVLKRCIDGWECNTARNLCVPVGAAEKPKEGQSEVVASEETTSQEEPRPEETTSLEKDGSAPEEAIITEPTPEQPQIQCVYSRAVNPKVCPVATDCERFDAVFEKSTTDLPSPLAGAAAVTNGFRLSAIPTPNRKLFLYLLGGGPNGTATNSVSTTEVSDQGVLVKWEKGPDLKQARSQASAFLIRDAVYVVGGKGADGKAVKSIERAAIKTDGTLEDFQEIGTWEKARLQAGIAYHAGYLFLAGGLDGDGKPTREVERILIRPDQTLSPAEISTPLPEALAGFLLSTHHHLYFLAPSTRRVVIALLKPDASLEGWCNTTSILSEIKDFQAFADARRLFLHSVRDTQDKLSPLLYFSPIKSSENAKQPFGGSLDSWHCSQHNTVAALVLEPRSLATAIIVKEWFYLLGGIDATSKTLATIERAPLKYRKDFLCDTDRDGIPNNFDFCPDIYEDGSLDPDKRNTDQPAGVSRPGAGNWIERFGLGNACESDGMILVPAGSFKRGGGTGPDETPGNVFLDTFYIDAAEITVRDYKECVIQGKCTEPKSKASATVPDYYDNDQYSLFPIMNVTWDQAKAYCDFRGKRLPSEAEWEKTARGLAGNTYPWGDGAPDCDKAHHKACGTDTQAVSKLPQSASVYKAFDLAGNVREWVADFYDTDAYKAAGADKNPKGPASGTKRVVRGGSFLSEPDGLRSSARGSLEPASHANDLGFRCARSLF